MGNSTTATVETLTAEVRVLMVGSRQVTLSVFGQLDEVEFEQIEPFGRVRPKGGDNYIWLVGRRKADGALVRAKTPVGEAIARELGFCDLEYARLSREAAAADKAAEKYEAWDGAAYIYGVGGGQKRTVAEIAAASRGLAAECRKTMNAMLGDYHRDRVPLWERAEEAGELPLIVLAGLR